MLSLVSYSVVLRSESNDVAAAVTSGAPDLVSLLDVVLCDSRRVSMLNAVDISRVDNPSDCALESSEQGAAVSF